MTGFAHTTVLGRITKDLELNTTASGKTLLPFTLAFDHNKTDTTFINCLAWGNQAENIAKYHNKGDLIAIQGALEQDNWEKDGVKHINYKVQVRSFEFMPNKRDDRPMTQAQALNGGKDVVLDDIEDKPIDLSAIPF